MRARIVPTAVVAVALCWSCVLTGCVADPPAPSSESASSASPLWTPPADSQAQGPTEAPAVPEETASLDEPIELSTGVTITVDGVSVMDITPETPGEVAGTAVVVTVNAKNTSDVPQSVESAVVTLAADDGEYGIGTTAGPGSAFSGDIAPGTSQAGIYVFMLNNARGRAVHVSVSYGPGAPVAIFAGSTP